jgi:hypothetical protein
VESDFEPSDYRVLKTKREKTSLSKASRRDDATKPLMATNHVSNMLVVHLVNLNAPELEDFRADAPSAREGCASEQHVVEDRSDLRVLILIS